MEVNISIEYAHIPIPSLLDFTKGTRTSKLRWKGLIEVLEIQYPPMGLAPEQRGQLLNYVTVVFSVDLNEIKMYSCDIRFTLAGIPLGSPDNLKDAVYQLSFTTFDNPSNLISVGSGPIYIDETI